MAALLLATASLAVGSLVTWLVARRVIHRPRLCFHLSERERIDLEVMIGHDAAKLAFGNLEVHNLLLLHLSITNRGRRDVIVHDAALPEGAKERPASATPLPRVDLRSVGVLAFQTLNPAPTFFVALAKQKTGHHLQHLHINLYRIAAGTTAEFRIIATVWRKKRPKTLSADDVHFFPGAIPDVDVVASGLLRKPFLRK